MPDYTFPIWSFSKNGTVVTIEPDFRVDTDVTDILIQGGKFKAVYIPETGYWSRNQGDAWKQIDQMLYKFANEEHPEWGNASRVVKYIRNASSGMYKRWNDYVNNAMLDSRGVKLDADVTYLNDIVTKDMYRSKNVGYSKQTGPHPCWDRFSNKFLNEPNKHKLEWSIGCMLSGDGKKVQKFVVIHGDPGTGKGSLLKVIKRLLGGDDNVKNPDVYWVAFDAGSLTTRGNAFPLEQFHGDPIAAFQEDGKLDKIEDNTRLNSLVSHEAMMVNEKNKSMYTNSFNAFLFIGTNSQVKITDAKSGILRRLIDIYPTGNTFEAEEYEDLLNGINFELGAIAQHCIDVYEADKHYYDKYRPMAMMLNTNHFYAFLDERYNEYIRLDGVTLGKVYEDYIRFVESYGLEFRMNKMKIKDELKNYYDKFVSHTTVNGEQRSNWYSGFLYNKFDRVPPKDILERDAEKEVAVDDRPEPWLKFEEPREETQLDIYYADCPATYARETQHGDWIPDRKWEFVKTTLSQIDPTKLHYVQTPLNLIVIDFDIKDAYGNKDPQKNLEAALKWPPTYAERSKSGAGIHLHYIYDGDPTQLSSIYDKDIEIKVYNGGSALRRIVTSVCNLAIAHISANLPLKEVKKKVIDKEIVETEKTLQAAVQAALDRKVNNVTNSTRCLVDYINWVLEKAYDSGVQYDLSDMYDDCWEFAASSSHQAEYCIHKIEETHFKSEEVSQLVELPPKSTKGLQETVEEVLDSLVVLDIEVKPDLLLVCYSPYRGKNVYHAINPSSADVRRMVEGDFAAFNGVRYDNVILYLRAYRETSIEECYQFSYKIIHYREPGPREARDLSKFDIYDILDNENRMGLKKLEIKYHMKHLEMETNWDAPLSGPDELDKLIKYCDWDVIAAKEVISRNKGSLAARMMLTAFAAARCTVAKSTYNTPENTLTQRLIIGNDIYKNPQGSYYHRDFSKPVTEIDAPMRAWLVKDGRLGSLDNFVAWNGEKSILPFWPGYEFKFIQKERNGKVVTLPYSIYRDIEIGEGGLVLFFPGIYYNTICLDVNGEHPTSLRLEYGLGPYTEPFAQLNDAKDYLKHKEFDKMADLMDGLFVPFLEDKTIIKPMRNAVKRACNAVYGQSCAHYENPLRDPNNKDNFVAKRGSLFMVDLYFAVLEKGFQVAHTKTDSIKIPNWTPELVDWVIDFGHYYGYNFEIEHKFEKFCLVNGSTYIAKLAEDDAEWMEARDDAIARGLPEPTRWTATAAEFKEPFVFKTMFSGEPIDWYDYWQTKQVSDGTMYLDMNEKDILEIMSSPEALEYIAYQNGRKKTVVPITAYDFTADPKAVESYLKWRKRKYPELPEIDIPHNYQFIGGCGAFVPVRPGEGGGILWKKSVDSEGNAKYDAVNGSKGYRWMEVEIVEEFGYQDKIDISYYRKLVDDAKDHINEVGNPDGITYEKFVSDWTPDIDDIVIDTELKDYVDFDSPEAEAIAEELRSQGLYI